MPASSDRRVEAQAESWVFRIARHEKWREFLPVEYQTSFSPPFPLARGAHRLRLLKGEYILTAEAAEAEKAAPSAGGSVTIEGEE